MKKILRQVNIKKYTVKCHCCDTEFEYQTNDLIFVRKVGMTCVECPSCGILIQHKGNQSSQITTEQL